MLAVESIPMDLSITRDCVPNIDSNSEVASVSAQALPDVRRGFGQTDAEFFRSLIRKYKKQMGDTDKTKVCSGGLQQYLNRQKDRHGSDIPERKYGEQCKFEHLPVNVRLHIFSYLMSKELCQASRVCRSWYNLTQDNLLWQELLNRDVRKWSMMGNMTHPDMYKELQSEWSNKDIYLRCSPEVTNLMNQQNAIFHSITNMLKYYLLPKKEPMFAMFGPGLESSTSCIVRKMMYENNTCFQRVGLFPGQFDGVGGGMKMKISSSGHVFNLSVLYSSTKREREAAQGDRMGRSRLVKENKNEETKEKYELMPAVRDFCKTVDGFIYVADASTDVEPEVGKEELDAMVSERWSATHIPVLVLSCVKSADCPRRPCVDVVNSLQMRKLNRPWQIDDCVAESLDGVGASLVWLVEQSRVR